MKYELYSLNCTCNNRNNYQVTILIEQPVQQTETDVIIQKAIGLKQTNFKLMI